MQRTNGLITPGSIFGIKLSGVGLQIVRDPDGLLNGKAPGTRSILDDSQRQALRQARPIAEPKKPWPSSKQDGNALAVLFRRFWEPA